YALPICFSAKIPFTSSTLGLFHDPTAWYSMEVIFSNWLPQRRSTTKMPAQAAGPAKQPAYKLLDKGKVTSTPLSSSPVTKSIAPAILNSAEGDRICALV